MLGNSQVHHSKLFVLLSTLSKKELKQLELWLASPIHNTSQEVLQFYRGLMTKYQKFDQPISKLSLLKYIDSSSNSKKKKELQPKEEALLRQITFKLTGQVQKFLVWQHINQDTFSEKYYLMLELNERKSHKLASGILVKLKKDLEISPHRDVQYYENLFKITEVEYSLEVVLNNRASQNKIQELVNALRQASLSKLLKFYCAAKNIENIRKVDNYYPFLQAVKKHIEENTDKDIPIIHVYFALLKLIEEQKPEYYYQLKDYLFKNLDAFNFIEIRQFLNHMTNYCIRSIKRGNNKFVEERHEIYITGLRLKCWSTGIYFSHHQFVNIVINALEMNKIEWVNDFINTYSTKLHPKIKKDILNYSYALVQFHLKQYDKAQNYLIKITSSEDFTYHLKFKILLVKIYYELQELKIKNADSHPINYELESIRHHIVSTRNKKMSESLRQSYNNFVNTFKSILERRKKLIYGEKLTDASVKKLKRKLPIISPLIERTWLEEKIDELLQ